MATSCSPKNILEVHFVADQNKEIVVINEDTIKNRICLLYTSDAADEAYDV